LEPENHCLCNDCINALPWLTSQCQQCALPLLTQGNRRNILCPECQKETPPFRRCVAAFHYQDPISKLITTIKTNPHAPELLQLSGLLATTIADRYETNELPQIIIPLPLHWRKLTHRGFNQSYSIARSLCQKLHLQGKHQRLRFMRNAFAVDKRIDGQSVAIVDDVVTTKATAIAAASSLIKAGAKSVDIWCIARTGWHIAAL
jgi:ComF family protein